MASINMSSIMSKAKASLSNSNISGSVDLTGNADAYAIVQSAGEDLVAAINREIGSTGRFAGAIGNARIVSISVSGTTGTVEIDIDKNHRPSLWPEGYPDGWDDMAQLFNNGYNAKNYVYGNWNGKRIRSRRSMPAMHFIQRAVDSFNGTGNRYTVISKEIGGRFEGKNESG